MNLAALLASLSLTLPAPPAQPAGRPAQPAALARAAAAPSGDSCDRVVARDDARVLVPSFQPSAWTLLDEGDFTFHYRFYARAGAAAVSAMTVMGSRAEGVVETKTIWEQDGATLVFMDGPVAEHDRLPLCVRSGRPGFTLDGLYRVLRPRLSR